MQFRLGILADLEEICDLVTAAVHHMNQQNIFQWDDIYPDKNILQQDIEKQQLSVGVVDEKIAVIYVLNQECDEAYTNGKWKYESASYSVIHRLCVHPAFQNQGIGKLTMEYIEKQVTLARRECIRLDAFIENPYALRLYYKLQYAVVGYADWRKGRFYLMEKKL